MQASTYAQVTKADASLAGPSASTAAVQVITGMVARKQVSLLQQQSPLCSDSLQTQCTYQRLEASEEVSS